MEELRKALCDLYALGSVPNDTLEALLTEGFDQDSVKRLSYDDWKEMVSDKTVPLPRALLYEIKYAMRGCDMKYLSAEARALASKPVVKLIEMYDNNENSELIEMDANNGNSEFLGSFTFLTPEGVGVTALHSVHVQNEIRQDSLRVQYQEELLTLKHLMSYPFHDLAFYKVEGLKEKVACVKLGSMSRIVRGQNIWLILFSSNDSQEDPLNLQGPDVVEGQVIKLNDNCIKGLFISNPGCGGGLVIDANGSPLGIHTSEFFLEDDDVVCTANKLEDEFMGDVTVKGLYLASPTTDNFEGAEVEELAHLSASNIGTFVPESVIGAKLLKESIVKRRKRKAYIHPKRRPTARRTLQQREVG